MMRHKFIRTNSSSVSKYEPIIADNNGMHVGYTDDVIYIHSLISCILTSKSAHASFLKLLAMVHVALKYKIILATLDYSFLYVHEICHFQTQGYD